MAPKAGAHVPKMAVLFETIEPPTIDGASKSMTSGGMKRLWKSRVVHGRASDTFEVRQLLSEKLHEFDQMPLLLIETLAG